MMQLYDITIAANTTRQLDAPGSYFYYYAGSAAGADSTITLRGLSSGLRIVLKPGQAFRLPAGQNETSWVITNYANAATIVGTVVVGDGDITDNRVTGSVEVVDGGKNRTNANQAFIAYASGGTPAAGNIVQSQLWNPAGSGKNIIVKRVLITASANQVMQLRSHTATLATLQGYGASKKIGGVNSIGEARYNNTLAAPSGSLLGLVSYIAGNGYLAYTFEEPIIVSPGTGIGTAGLIPAVDMPTTYEYYEESI